MFRISTPVSMQVDQEIIDCCGKMRVFDQMIDALLERGHKVLIFSQMTRMLDILGDYLGFKVSQTNSLSLHYSKLDVCRRISNTPAWTAPCTLRTARRTLTASTNPPTSTFSSCRRARAGWASTSRRPTPASYSTATGTRRRTCRRRTGATGLDRRSRLW